jgi:hypothetical protein
VLVFPKVVHVNFVPYHHTSASIMERVSHFNTSGISRLIPRLDLLSLLLEHILQTLVLPRKQQDV